jgi:hypothetical protein
MQQHSPSGTIAESKRNPNPVKKSLNENPKNLNNDIKNNDQAQEKRSKYQESPEGDQPKTLGVR